VVSREGRGNGSERKDPQQKMTNSPLCAGLVFAERAPTGRATTRVRVERCRCGKTDGTPVGLACERDDTERRSDSEDFYCRIVEETRSRAGQKRKSEASRGVGGLKTEKFNPLISSS